VVECVVFVVCCVAVFALLKTCQIFAIYFWGFPFWESAVGKWHTPGAEAPFPCAGTDAKPEGLAYLEATETGNNGNCCLPTGASKG
jgi:hypothetical protein